MIPVSGYKLTYARCESMWDKLVFSIRKTNHSLKNYHYHMFYVTKIMTTIMVIVIVTILQMKMMKGK
jgi:hypothetical protein